MPNKLEDEDWTLLRRVKDGKRTPFIGPGVDSEKTSVISHIANEWTEEYDYPLEDSYDLVRVAQFAAMVEDLMTPKEEMCKESKNCLLQN